MRNLLNNSRGDTIIEVMIAMAVASAVLGSSYTITNRSLANSQQAQEHSAALKLAQSQIEQIRAFAQTRPSSHPMFDAFAHCIAYSGVQKGQVVDLTQVSVSSPANDDSSKYIAECKDIGDVNFRTAFTYDNTRSTFTVYVSWDGITGQQDQVSAVYKAYPGV